MINIQVINPLTEKFIAFDGENVVRDSDQVEIGSLESVPTIPVSIVIMPLVTDSLVTFSMVESLEYNADVDFWFFPLELYKATLMGHIGKHVAKVSEIGSTVGMRPFKINEFGIYCDDLDNVIAQLPYHIEVGTGSKIVWYEKNHFEVSGHEVFEAPIYKNSTGTEPVEHPSEITHRGPLSVIIPIS
jgi:hypothetical protein